MSSDTQQLPPGFYGSGEDASAAIQFHPSGDFDENDPVDIACIVQTTAEASHFAGFVTPSHDAYSAALKSGDISLATQHVQSHNLRQKIASWNQKPKN